MKLHLPLSLRSSLLALFATVVAQTAQASLMSNNASHITYTDFGQNCGRYVAGDGGNALLKYIRQQEGGIAITYTNGQADYIIPNSQGMVDFSTGYSNSTGAAISPSLVATVGHNNELEGTFTTRVHGIGNAAINYAVIGFGTGNMFSNSYNDGQYHDYRISRYSKIFTDVTPAQICSSTQEAKDLAWSSKFYHSGGGFHKRDDGTNWPYQAYVYPTGGIISAGAVYDTTAGGVNVQVWYHNGSINNDRPLNYASLAGDSGSPVYVYDAEEGVYKFWGCAAMSGVSQSTYLSYTNKYQEVMNKYNKVVNMPALGENETVSTVYLNAVNIEGEEKSDGSNSTRLYYGAVTDANGNELTRHVGLQTGLNTWKDLDGIKNDRAWYAYGNNYVNQSDVDLFFTENLVFNSSAENNAVVLNATVDLGIGYTEFNAAGSGKVSYTISSAEGGSYMLNSAGYVVNENASVHVELTSAADYMYEWRKTGAGDFYIEGKNDNNVLLNLGGTGTTYLKRESGYAAYNVLVNTGATVVIDDICQIERDLTFGHKGGVLDMNGNDMDWYVTCTADTIANDGFTIKALTEDAIIANHSGSATLVYKESGDNTWVGSFRDTADSSLKIQYAGGGTWTLNGINTNLQHADSGLQVDNGKVVLRGTNTVHGTGSANGRDTNRYTHADDWHYADAAMDVTVKNGATFELGSHARLTGDVTVEGGGLYVMREGVKLSQEYVEGGQRLEDVSKYAAYYGHKGNTVLDGGTLRVEYSAGVTANNTYAGNISGSGNMSVDLKDSAAVFTLSGDNTFTGTKTLVSGGLIADSATALGDTSANKWVIQEEGWIVSHKETGAQLLEHIDTSSTGTLALSADTEQLDLADYNDLFIGAESGKTVQYGTLGTSQTLNAVDGAWRLGGGGGTLVVNYVLSGENDLLLGATENSTGVVHLTNQGNSFTGNIVFSGEGVLLTYEDGALGSAIVDLSYGNAGDLFSASDVLRMSSGSDGMVLVDNFSDHTVDLRNHALLTVGVAADKTWSGEFWLAENQAYRFGTLNGATLTVTSALEAGHDLIVDAQGSSGGKVVLDATGITGQVSVMGRKDGTGGDITLAIAQDDALSAASGVSVQNGGILELGDSSHVLHNVEVQAGGQIKATSASDLIFNITEDSTVAGRVQLGTVEKTGAANLALSGDAGSSWSLLTISEGTVTVGSGTLGSNIALAGGVLAADSDAVVNYNGNISIAEGATESIRGGSWKLSGAENIVNKGTLNLQNTKLYFNSTSAQKLDGTLTVTGTSELHSIESNGADNMQKHLEHIHVTSGNELKIVDHTWNTIWHIDKLTGNGTFKWNPQNTHYYGSSVIIDGNGRFSGTLDFYRQHDPGYADTAETYSRNFQTYLQIDNEEAISRATLKLTGTWCAYVNRNAYATLALNDERIKIGGLNATGDAFAHVMAGAAPSGVSRSAPDSTRSATLEITGSGNYEYKGSVGTEADKTSSYGVSIAMTGTGTQLFNGSTVVVNDVDALNGTLNFNSAGLYIKGDVTVAQGATLKLNDSFTLGSGHTLNVVAGANGGSAVLNSGLVFDGGTLHFDVLSSSQAALTVNGTISAASDTAGMNLTFADTDALQLGVKYLLASGDWTGMDGRISLVTPELYKQMTCEAGASGLSIQLDMKEGFAYWGGDTAELQPGAKLVFTGGGENLSSIDISGGAQADTAVFDNETDFTISATDGSTLAIGTMEKHETGALVVNTNVTADTLRVEDKSALTGTGKLAVGEISGSGTLQVAGGAHLQVEAGEGATLHLLDGAMLTTTGTALGTDLVLGEDAAASRVNLDIQGSELSLNGAFEAKENTTLVVQGTGALNYNAGMNGLAEIQLSSTNTLNVGTTLSTKVAQNGATVNVNSGGVWQVAAENSPLAGTVNVNTGGVLSGKDVALTSGFVELSGQMEYDSFTVENGATLNLRQGGRLDAANAATISGTGVMRLNQLTLSDKVNLENGGTMYGYSGTIGSGAKVLATAGTGKLNAGGGTFNVNGTIGAAEGATLRLENGTFSVNHGSLNTGGGTLELACTTVNLSYLVNNSTQTIGGTLRIDSNLTLNVRQGNPNSYQSIVHNINHLHINESRKLTIVESGDDWRHVFNVSSLSGKGEIEWQTANRWFSHTAMGPSRLILTGDNTFEGSLLINQRDNHGSMQHVSLAHENAARNMVINLWGDGDSRPGLAISTKMARVAGIGGTTNTFVYAGAVKADNNGDNPASSALNTLIINTAGKEHTYNGTILGDAANGLNIVKDGTGTQTFTNAANVVHDVTALQGHLEFTTAPTIHGDISIAQGAQLTIGSGAYSLDAGHTLSVLAGAAGSSATLNNALVLNGGSLIFGAYGESSAALITGGVSLGAEVQQQSISFTNLGSLSFNKEYTLASGDWSALAGKLTIGDSGYLTASLSADANGLRASFEMAADYVGWTGDETVLTDDARVVFAGFGGVNTAEISENHTVAEGYFDNGETFTVSSANGLGLQFGRMEMTGSGAVVLNTAVSTDTMIIKDAATLKGAGSLTVENLDIQSNLTTGMALDVTNNITAANGAQWILDGSEGEFTQNLSLGQMSALDSIRVEGDAVLSVDMGADDMSLTDARISGSGRLSLTGSGSFTKNYNGALNIADISLANATFKGNGTTTISGEVAISDKLNFGTEKVILASGAEVTTNQLRLGTSAENQNTSLNIEAGAILTVKGTTVEDSEANSILLAHWKGSASTLVMNGGTLDAGGTAMHMGWDSGGTFQAMSGVANLKGILFSTARDNADRFILGSEMSGTARVNIGSDGITGFRANDTVQLGNGTIAATSDFSITGNGGVVQLVGEETGTIFDTAGHTITVNSVMQGEGKLVVNGSGTLKLTHSSGTSDISDLSGTGMFVKAGAGNLNLHKASLANATFKGNGTTTISGDVSITGKLDFGTEKVILASGAEVTTNQLRLGTSEQNQNTSLSIEAGATLNISGTTFTDAEGKDETISLLLAHWSGSASTLVLNGGTLNASGTTMHMGWDSGGTFQAMSGVANLKGIFFSTTRNNADRFILGSEMSGTARVNIGSDGITGFRANDTVQLGNGTIAATSDFSITGNGGVVQLVGEETGTIFDTAGHTITVNSVMQGEGKLVVNGSGVLNLAHAAGTTEIASLSSTGHLVKSGAGNLKLQDASLSSALFTGNGSVKLTGEVDIAEDLSLGSGEVILQQGANVSLKGISFAEKAADEPAARLILGVATLNIGSGGISGFGANDTVQLGGGTIAATDDFSISGPSVQLVESTEGTTFDTADHSVTVNAELTGNGTLKKIGRGELNIAGESNTLANAIFKGNGTVNISGAVDISGELSIGKGTVNLLNGASVTASRFIAGNTENSQGSIVTIKEGAELTITGNTDTDTTSASFLLTHWKESASTMVLDGGKLIATDTCMLMGWDSAGRFEALSGEATLKGIRFSSERQLADTFILRGATVNIGSGGITGFSGNDGDSVQLGDGTILAMDDFVISGSNSVVLNGTTDKGTVFDANGHTITVQAAMDSDENSALTIQNGTLKQSGNMWFDRMHVAEGASFVKDSVEVIGQSAASAIVKSANASGDELQYFNDGNHEIQNARVKVESAEARELKSQLTHSTVENAGSGHLTVSNTANRLSGVVASGGDMTLMNLAAATSVDLLEITAGKTVNAYVGSNSDSKAALTVTGSALLSGGSTLNAASLTLADGATLDMENLAAGAVMNGALTFAGKVQAGNKLLSILRELNEWEESQVLITGLSKVTLADVDMTEGQRVLASSVFSDVRNSTLHMEFKMVGDVGALLVINVPEPATSTLGLLALAALAARRRRR